MAFKFRLQSVLTHRLYLEDVAKSELAVQVQARNRCQQRIDWLQEEMSRYRREMAEKEKHGMAAGEFILANEYVTVLRLQIMREQSKLPLLDAQIELARQNLVKAVQNRKAMEILRSRDLEQYTQVQLKLEQNLLDEVAVSAFVRNSYGQ